MDLTQIDLKTAFDLGAGLAALALWYKQRDINRSLSDSAAKGLEAVRDLTVLVKEHDQRLSALETLSRKPCGGRSRKRGSR